MVEAFDRLVTFFVYAAIVFPLIGAAILYGGFQLAKVPGFTFVRCWKIYLAGLCYGYLIIMGLVFIFQKSLPVTQTVLFFAIPLVAIPLLARDYSRRTILVEIVVILLANSIMLALLVMTLSHVLKPQTDRRPAPLSQGLIGRDYLCFRPAPLDSVRFRC
jgi:hypothetical protein